MKAFLLAILAFLIFSITVVAQGTTPGLNYLAEWTGTAQGVLPALAGQTAIDAAYGSSMTSVGDINHDGYDDVVVGMPGMADVISGSGQLSSVGAVFIYYGGPNGLPSTPNIMLQPSTAVTGALFGFSIAAGDVDNDGTNDIIVGAPMDKVTISTGGSGTASGTVGKVYVFSGAQLGAGATTPLLTLQLSGSGILENGINLSVKALFGYSVAVTEDLNGDGKKDILVGAPAYAGIKAGFLGGSVLDVQSGGAFEFLSSSGNNNFSLVKLDPPTSSLLGLGLFTSNINGLLFGISVDGTGDYNGDGKPDVVVGAPAGVNLGSISGLLTGQLLQGSALVYYGTGSGLQTSAGATLAASSGGLITNLSGTLSNLVNLFGFSVKGVKNAAGVRTGNILVGAPLGGTLTNLLGGLQVKTGTVNVFVKKSSSPSGVVAPTQQLSSPRNSNNLLNIVQSNLLMGFSMDNAYDMNCDGIGDIIVGEPASSGAQLIATNAVGGAAYVYTGNADGTYQATPAWTLGASYNALLGVNAASLTGYSVAGVRKIKGSTSGNKVMAGAPGLTLNFGSGLLNLGNTLGTLFGLAAGNNGVGKSFELDPQLCSASQGQSSLPLNIIHFNAVASGGTKVLLSWDVVTEKDINAYSIQRSSDGSSWQVFGVLPGNAGSTVATHYALTDNHPYSGISYYRVQQLDIDNSSFYTDIKAVNLGAAGGGAYRLSATNPFSQSITLRLDAPAAGDADISLLDITGKIIQHQQNRIGNGINTISLIPAQPLSNGIYFIRLTTGGQLLTTKLVRQ